MKAAIGPFRGCVFLLCLTACAPRAAVLRTEMAPIRRLAVQPFEGDAGGEITRDFVQALKASGWIIADKKQSADAVLAGTVHDFKAGHKLMVFLGDTNTLTGGNTATVSNPVVSMNGSQVLPQGPSASMTSPHMVTEYAMVAVSARLSALPSGTIVWGDEFNYESLQLADARRIVVTALVKSLGAAAPHLQREVPVKAGPR